MRAILLSLFIAALLLPVHAGATFYQGKTVTIISGTTAGSAYDTYARLIATHMSKHIPGNPNLIVQNMPGGGSIIAANYLYGVAKPNGFNLALINPALFFTH